MEWKKFGTPEEREQVCQEILNKAAVRRHKGDKEYGIDNFFDVDNMEYLEEELLDVINYAIFEIIKIRQIKKRIDESTKINK